MLARFNLTKYIYDIMYVNNKYIFKMKAQLPLRGYKWKVKVTNKLFK